MHSVLGRQPEAVVCQVDPFRELRLYDLVPHVMSNVRQEGLLRADARSFLERFVERKVGRMPRKAERIQDQRSNTIQSLAR